MKYPQALTLKNLSMPEQMQQHLEEAGLPQPDQEQEKSFMTEIWGWQGHGGGSCIDWYLVHSRKGSCLLKSPLSANGQRGQKLMGRGKCMSTS